MIYFVQDPATCEIKIGFTEGRPEKRVRQLQTGNPRELVLLLTLGGCKDDEWSLHYQFRASRVGGEWFRPTPDLMKFILEKAEEAGRLRLTTELIAGAKHAALPEWPLRIYLGGDVGRVCWRGRILRWQEVEGCAVTEDQETWPPLLPEVIFATHDFTGPFMHRDRDACTTPLDSEHECSGRCGYSNCSPDMLWRLRQRAIGLCDVVFCWVESDSFDAIQDAMYARAQGKLLWIAGLRRFSAASYAYELADRLILSGHGPASVLQECLSDLRDEYETDPEGIVDGVGF